MFVKVANYLNMDVGKSKTNEEENQNIQKFKTSLLM